MTKVAIITEMQANDLSTQLVQLDWYFYPLLDCNNNWVISQQEIDASIYPQNDWVKFLNLIDWCEPIIPPSGSTMN